MSKKYLIILIVVDVIVFTTFMVLKYLTIFEDRIFDELPVGLFVASVMIWSIGIGFVISLIPIWNIYDWQLKIETDYKCSVVLTIIALIFTVYFIFTFDPAMFYSIGMLNVLLAFKLWSEDRALF